MSNEAKIEYETFTYTGGTLDVHWAPFFKYPTQKKRSSHYCSLPKAFQTEVSGVHRDKV